MIDDFLLQFSQSDRARLYCDSLVFFHAAYIILSRILDNLKDYKLNMVFD